MTAYNPIIRLVEHPVAALGDLAIALLFVTGLVFSWWALGHNLVSLAVKTENRSKRGWHYLPPLTYVAQLAAIPLITAIDALLVGAMIHLIW